MTSSVLNAKFIHQLSVVQGTVPFPSELSWSFLTLRNVFLLSDASLQVAHKVLFLKNHAPSCKSRVFWNFFLLATVRYLNAYTGIVLLRCRKEFYQLVWSALPFITYLENKGYRYPCFFNTLHVGGMVVMVACRMVIFSDRFRDQFDSWVGLLSHPRRYFSPALEEISQAVDHKHSFFTC